MSTDSNGRGKLIESLQDREYRHLFRRASYKRGLAEQIREMRLSRGWTQAELANASGKVQETISQIENPNYGNYTLKTLDRLAEAFDVALIVKFAPFSELADWMTNLSPEDLAVPDFEHDPGLNPPAASPEPTQTADVMPPARQMSFDNIPYKVVYLQERRSSPPVQAADTTAQRLRSYASDHTQRLGA